MTLTVPFHKRIVLAESETTKHFAELSFGTTLAGGKLQLSLLEAHYLVEKKLLMITDARGKMMTAEQFERKASNLEPDFTIRSAVFDDLRARGYVVKTGLKYGADFVVYDRGIKPGQDHAQWVVYPVHESERERWHAFSAKNRVAHTTKKRLLIGIVDDERSVTYYEIKWIRP